MHSPPDGWPALPANWQLRTIKSNKLPVAP
jgi:hypothetical protein